MNRPAPSGGSPWIGWIRRLRIPAILLLVAAVAACRTTATVEGQGATPKRPLDTTLYVAIGMGRATLRDPKLQQKVRNRISELEASFQELHPGVRLEQLVFEEDRMVAEIRRRTRSGLAPDLILTEGLTAEALHREGLIRPLPFPSPASSRLRRELIPYVKATPRLLFALPVGLQPQLACFDKRRITRSPATLQALLAESSRGKRFGLSLNLVDLAWTLGSLGGLESLSLVQAETPPSAKQRAGISTWLRWLRTADLQQRITLVTSRDRLLTGLRSGDLDWISCRSQDVNVLTLDLGRHLGLAPLPAGPAGPPSPISSVRVAALGRNSSPRQQEAANALLALVVSPQVQRLISISTEAQLPVSTEASLPVASSANLAALLSAQRQADDAQNYTRTLIALRGEAQTFNRILIRFHYGELSPAEATEALIQALRPDDRDHLR